MELYTRFTTKIEYNSRPLTFRAHQTQISKDAEQKDRLPSLNLYLKKIEKPRGEFMKLSERQDTFEPHELMII